MKKEEINRRTFLADMGKTIFYAGLSALALPTLLNTGCSKDDDKTATFKGECVTSRTCENHLCVTFDCKDNYTCNPAEYFTCNFPGFSCIAPAYECPEPYGCIPPAHDCTPPSYDCILPGYACTPSSFDCSSPAYGCVSDYNHSGGKFF